MSMGCIKCEHRADCTDSRSIDANATRRRYRCLACGERWTTLEQVVPGAGSDSRSLTEKMRAIHRREALDRLMGSLRQMIDETEGAKP